LLIYLRKENVLSLMEESRIKEAGHLQDQVEMLSTILISKDNQGFDPLQTFIESSDSHIAQLIMNHDTMIKEHKEVLLRTHEQYRGRDSLSGPKHHIPSRALHLLEGLSDLQQKENDLMQVGINHGGRRIHQRQLCLERQFEPLTRVSLPPRLSLTVGVAGIGKTTCVRHFIRQWSQGVFCKDVSFILPFSFSELNSLEKLSAESLVKMAFPHLKDPSLILSSSCKTMLIFDGLDEFQSPLNFANVTPCSDPKKEVSIEDLIMNIIQGNLLPDTAVWVTSRPGAASCIPGGLIDRVTEIPEFSHQDIQNLLRHHFLEMDFDRKIWAHLKSHKALMVMCYIPCICWIVADTLLYIMQNGKQESLPRTCTELLAHFCSMQAEVIEPRGREPIKVEQLNGSNRKLLGNLGRMAFYGLLKHKYIFSEQDLRAYGIDTLLAQCSFAAGILLREESAMHISYRFIHLTLQEFLAATYYYVSSKRAIFDLFSESTVSWPKFGFQNHFKNAIQRSQDANNGHLDVFVRFLTGLLCPMMMAVRKAWAAEYLQGLLVSGGTVVSMRKTNLAYCLQELQHTELLRSVEEDLRLGSLAGKLTWPNCIVLGYLLHVSPECNEQTNLAACLNFLTVKCLLPQLLYCIHLRLENNYFKDDVMELLGSLLTAKDCRIQKMSLADNLISNKGAKALSRALLVNRTLTSLNIRKNKIGADGAEKIAKALWTNRTLTKLVRTNVDVDFTAGLSDTSMLPVWIISSNSFIYIVNIKPIFVLSLCSNQVGDKGTTALAEALTHNHTLLSLQLQSNSISNKGMTALTKALRLNRGLMSLNLKENSIGVEGAKNMAQALHENSTLKDLDLTANLLHDEGVQAIAGSIKLNQSLVSLHLQWNFIKSMATKALAHALLFNNTITLLDLQENAIGDEGVISLAEALKTNTSLCTLWCALFLSECYNAAMDMLCSRNNDYFVHSCSLQENSLGMDGAIFIATAMKENNHLQYINLQGNSIGKSGAKVISDAIRVSAPACVVDI
uniref:NLR family CARD domain-containing protein 3-like n=1 Tax=Gouania willdenowi TaxID=441366 RepID=A0A8C5EKC7_GOUWI